MSLKNPWTENKLLFRLFLKMKSINPRSHLYKLILIQTLLQCLIWWEIHVLVLETIISKAW